MKPLLRLLLALLTLPLLPLWLFIPPLCLLIIATEYAWRGKVRWANQRETEETPMTVKQQQTKGKDLRKHLVAWINERPGRWLLGINVTDNVRIQLRSRGIHTSGEVLAKELRRAQRKGEIRKRIRPRTVYVEYTAIGQDSC